MENVIRLLAASHYLSLKQMSEDRFLTTEELKKVGNSFPFEEYTTIHRLLYEQLGFEYDSKDFISNFRLLNKKDSIWEFVFYNTIEKNKIAEKVGEIYGEHYYMLYCTVTVLCNLLGITSVAKHLIALKDEMKTEKAKKRAGKFEQEILLAYKECSFMLKNPKPLSSFYSNELVEKVSEISNLSKFKRINLKLLSDLNTKLFPLFLDFVPEYYEIEKNQKNAMALIDELKSINPGFQHWSKYEKFCIKTLNYLLLPDFRKVYTQASNDTGYERRDAIVPNTSKSRFWIDIKNEFKSKNIVFEFKNLSKDYSKTELNQIRIYLSKPTIGKFGVLFVRKLDDKKALLQAQRDAYEQNGILILIVDDFLLEKMIYSRAYFGNCDDILANEKVKFEIGY